MIYLRDASWMQSLVRDKGFVIHGSTDRILPEYGMSGIHPVVVAPQLFWVPGSGSRNGQIIEYPASMRSSSVTTYKLDSDSL